MPVGDRPALEILVAQLADDGFQEITIALGYLGHLIRAVIGDGVAHGTTITYTTEATPLGTAGALRLVPDLRPDDVLLVVNGDTLTDLSFRDLVTGHIARGSAATLAVQKRTERTEFGVIDFDADGRLRDYREKPEHSFHVSMGVNVLTIGPALEVLPAGPVDMPALLLGLQAAGHRVDCEPVDVFWLDLGRISDLRAASEAFDQERSRFLRPG